MYCFFSSFFHTSLVSSFYFTFLSSFADGSGAYERLVQFMPMLE